MSQIQDRIYRLQLELPVSDVDAKIFQIKEQLGDPCSYFEKNTFFSQRTKILVTEDLSADADKNVFTITTMGNNDKVLNFKSKEGNKIITSTFIQSKVTGDILDFLKQRRIEKRRSWFEKGSYFVCENVKIRIFQLLNGETGEDIDEKNRAVIIESRYLTGVVDFYQRFF